MYKRQPNHYKAQHTFSNGKRVDFFLNFGDTNSTEGIPIDSKFSWENYKKMEEAEDPNIKKQCAKDFAEDIKKHVNAVSEYVIEGETGPIALMFVAARFQRCGIARELLKRSISHARPAKPGLDRVTVNSSRFGVAIYEKLGFRQTGPERTINGIVFIPMAHQL